MNKDDEINLPLYLGFCKEENAYYFYGQKEGVGRFLKYSAYFYWASNPPAILNTKKEIPEEVNKELVEFLTGKIGYEFIKQRKNSRNQTVRKYFRTPPELIYTGEEGRGLGKGSDNVPREQPVNKESDSNPGLGTGRKRTRRNNDEQPEPPKDSSGTENSKSGRRSRKPDGSVHGVTPEPVLIRRKRKDKVMEIEPPKETEVAKSKKSQKPVKAVEEKTVQHENLESPKKRTRRTVSKNADVEITISTEAVILKESDDNQLGPLVVKRGRGRPRKNS